MIQTPRSRVIIAIIVAGAILLLAAVRLYVQRPPADSKSAFVDRFFIYHTIVDSAEKAHPAEAKILFVGDLMFDRYIRQVGEKHGDDFIFSCLDPLLRDADFAVGNLEGPITAYPSSSQATKIGSPENFRFTFPTTTANLLLEHNIRVVNIGNNHINNYGREGIDSTRMYLDAAGVSYFGGLAGKATIYRMTHNGQDLSFVNYNQFGGDSAEKVAKLIATEHDLGRIVIVYTHWGVEYADDVESLRDEATLFAQSGAALIVGSHPHIVQASELIGKTPVYYSLGNFIFDQFWNAKVSKGLALLVHISDGEITIEEKFVRIGRDGRTCPI